jgi:hypothetical protein
MKNLTLARLLVGGGGAIAFIFSFLDFAAEGRFGVNAWDTDAWAFASTVPAILGLVAAIWVGLEIAEVKLPDDVLTFNAAQLKATWGISAAGIMLSWFSTNDSKAIGYWLMFIGSLAMAAGAIISLLGIGNDPLSAGNTATTGTDSTATASPDPAAGEALTEAPPAAPPPAPSDNPGQTPPPPPA